MQEKCTSFFEVIATVELFSSSFEACFLSPRTCLVDALLSAPGLFDAVKGTYFFLLVASTSTSFLITTPLSGFAETFGRPLTELLGPVETLTFDVLDVTLDDAFDEADVPL